VIFDPVRLPAQLTDGGDALGARLEDAGLTSSQPPQQSIYDGWLLRYSPGKAKRARSVNAIGAGLRPLAEKLAYVETFFRRAALPCLFRITPFTQPNTLDRFLDGAGYLAGDESRVMATALPLAQHPAAPAPALEEVDAARFARVAGVLRGSPESVIAAELQRIVHAALPARYLTVSAEGEVAACGSVLFEDDVAGVFNMVTATGWRGRGLATALVSHLLRHAADAGARVAYLQVDAANAPARHVYEKFGFRDRYAYWYRAQPDQGDAR
jgi:ribosomal protein S18 acetylase RimI-like enzyme